MLEGDAGVAEVRILECEHFETGARLVAGLGAVGTELQINSRSTNIYKWQIFTSIPSQRRLR